MPLFGPPTVEKMKDKGDIPGLLKALGHETPAVRKEAACALGILRAVKAEAELVFTVMNEWAGVCANEPGRSVL